MGLMQRAYETYCAMEGRYAGRYIAGEKEEKGEKEPLAPVGHIITTAHLEITLDEDGSFVSARAVDKSEPKVIIPVTPESAGRVGDTSCAHPLCDQLRFLASYSGKKYCAYLEQLRNWANSEYSHPKLLSILRYVEKGTILSDLMKYQLIELNEKGIPVNEKLMVCWRVLSNGEIGNTEECWKDISLFQSFIRYYTENHNTPTAFCMITGREEYPASQHPKGIIPINGNAKLISANDTSGFTYRGRFAEDWQAATVGYVASQKIHSALRWIAANQGACFGGRTFLCWNPQGILLPKATGPVMRNSTEIQRKPSDYKLALDNTLKGWKEQLPADAAAVITAFDAATTGRLSVTYFNELQASDFLERLHDWDTSCCWWNGAFGIQSPSLFQIVSYAFGTPRTEKNKTIMDTDPRVMRKQIQRLLSCRIDKGKMPLDVDMALFNRASNLQIFENEQREALLFTACAVIRKYHFDRNGEEWKMEYDPKEKDVSYQYGRLLAVLEKIERDTYDKEETREPNAIRMQMVFSRRPSYIGKMIWEHVRVAYYPRLKPGIRKYYDGVLGDIVAELKKYSIQELNRSLGDLYLLGYYIQRNELYKSKKQQDGTEE